MKQPKWKKEGYANFWDRLLVLWVLPSLGGVGIYWSLGFSFWRWIVFVASLSLLVSCWAEDDRQRRG